MVSFGISGAYGSSVRPTRRQEITRRVRQRMAVAAINKSVEPNDEQGEDFNYLMASGYKHRSAESVQKSRKVEIDKFVKNGYVEDWKIDEARATGAKILSGTWVDPDHKEKSRWCAREFATYKDPTVFAAASEEITVSMIDFIAVKKGQKRMGFDAVSAFTQAPEEELIFIEPPPEYQAECAERTVWRCLRAVYGRRSGAKNWQERLYVALSCGRWPLPRQ